MDENYSAGIVENSILRLTLDCDSQIIELDNKKSNVKPCIPIDLTVLLSVETIC